jgi:hypothetical protein
LPERLTSVIIPHVSVLEHGKNRIADFTLPPWSADVEKIVTVIFFATTILTESSS